MYICTVNAKSTDHHSLQQNVCTHWSASTLSWEMELSKHVAAKAVGGETYFSRKAAFEATALATCLTAHVQVCESPLTHFRYTMHYCVHVFAKISQMQFISHALSLTCFDLLWICVESLQ